MRAQTIEDYGGLLTVRPSRVSRPGARAVSEALARTIEGEIIPRLMLAHRSERATDGPVPTADDVSAFTNTVLHRDVADALHRVDELGHRGLSVETLLLDLLAPSARLLGDYWLSDRASFADVTIALTRLHRVLNDLSDRGEEREAAEPRRALLAPAGYEQHTFGLAMVAAFMRRAGWSTSQETGPAGVLRAVRRRRFDVVGLTASCEARLDGLAERIAAIRRASCNPDLTILVGGPLFVARPDLAHDVGADGTALDARVACRVAESLVAKRRGHS